MLAISYNIAALLNFEIILCLSIKHFGAWVQTNENSLDNSF